MHSATKHQRSIISSFVSLPFVMMTAFLLVIMSGCKEDIMGVEPVKIENDIGQIDSSLPSLEGFSVRIDSLSDREINGISYFLTGVPFAELGAKSSFEKEFRRIIKSTLEQPPLVVENEAEESRVLSFLVPDPDDGDLLNIVVLQHHNKIKQAQLYKYALAQSFKDSLKDGTAKLGDYVGPVDILPVAAVVESLQKNSFADCFNLAIHNSNLNKPTSSGGGGPTGPTNGGPSSGPTIGGGPGSGNGSGGPKYECTKTRTVTWTDSNGQQHTTIYVERCGYERPIARDKPGDELKEDQRPTIEEIKSINKSLEDCGELLRILGVRGRYNTSNLAAGSRDQQFVEATINGTSYDVLAILAIVDIAKLRSCGGTLDCLNEQVSAYLAEKIYIGYTGPLRSTFQNLNTDQLAVLLSAYYGSSGNGDVIKAVRFVASNGIFLNSSQLGVHVLALSILHNKNPSQFNKTAVAYQALVKSNEILSENSLMWLAQNPLVLQQIVSAIESNPYIKFKGLTQLLQEDETGRSVSDIVDNWVDWSKLEDNPEQLRKSPIKIGWTTIHTSDFSTPVVMEFPRRHGPIRRDASGKIISPNDLTYSSNPSLEEIDWSTRPVQKAWKNVEDLVSATTLRELNEVGEDFIRKFRNNTGGTYTNKVLTQAVSETPEFINMMTYVGEELEKALTEKNYDIGLVVASEEIELTPNRHLSLSGYEASGLTILLNDTETTQFHIEDFQVVDPANNKWEATLGVKIIDHFGLDREDVLRYQTSGTHWGLAPTPHGDGFSAWYLLQHKFGYKPFQTELFIRVRLKN